MSRKLCANKPAENNNGDLMFKEEKLESNSFTTDISQTFGRYTVNDNHEHAIYEASGRFITNILFISIVVVQHFSENPVSRLCNAIGGLVQ